ncbi:hypothetical protein PV326_013590 [Microctonus aethiopoides]|nr:hypothetical protein PV326_013590 [Microctonus aethiopoides]
MTNVTAPQVNSSNCETYHCVTCNCNCGTTATQFSIIPTIKDIVKDTLKGIDLMMNTFRNTFDNLKFLTELPRTPNNQQLTLDPLLDDFARVNKTVGHIINIFRNLFGDPICNTRMSPLDRLSQLNNRTTQSLSCLFNMGLPNIPNLSNITDSMQRNVSSILRGLLQNDKLFPRLSVLKLMFRTPSIQMNNDTPTMLQNIQNGFFSSLPRIRNLPNITGKLSNISFMRPANLFRMNPISRIFNLTATISNLKTLLESVRNIPERIVQFFKTIRETLMPLGIVKENWNTIKTDPLFLAQSCSSKLEGLYQFSRYEPPSRYKRIKSKLFHHKHSSLWDKLKSKLFNHFKC